MEILIGAVVLMWIFAALKGEKSFEANIGWLLLGVVAMVYFSLKGS